MGKKTKIGKQRKDKYYQLAKETGYRSRAAFKLIQLNRKFGFLQKSRVCIDLCAAPGGWMQVAQQNMPLSSVVIGVDLFPIKTVPGCISLTEDITTEKCKTAISKEIKTWKADVVLNDGAPNVGLNWLHDAYQQATLTLSALKLATHFLREGGWFITKVFRSKDYHPLIWVFKQLFKKVHATKPQASRNESSEIFVVCQGYLAPDSIDPKFLDHKYVFEEFEVANKNKFNLLHPEKAKKAKAVGYEENNYTQHRIVPITQFLKVEDPIDLLQGCSEILIDDKAIEQHERTTVEIKECCKDIKVLGRKDLKNLMNWLKHMKEFKASQEPAEKSEESPQATEPVKSDQEESDDEENKIDEQIADIQEEERRQSRRKRKQLNKQRQKLAEKMNLKMVLKGDDGPVLQADDMFRLTDIRDANEMKRIIDQQPDIVAEESESDDEMKIKAKYMKYNVDETNLDKSGTYYKDSDSELEIESDSDSGDEKETLGFSDNEEDQNNIDKMTKLNTAKNSKKSSKSKKHPLLTDLEDDPMSRRSMKAELWFEKDSLKAINEEDDEDIDLDKLAATFKQKGKKVSENALKENTSRPIGFGVKRPATDSGVSSDDSDDSSSDSDYDLEETVTNTNNNKNKDKNKAAGGPRTTQEDGYEVVSQDKELKRLKRTLKLDSEMLALGSMIASSKKFKRDLKDDAFNRYMFQDTNLPDWFVEDEAKNMKRPIAVPKEEVEEYKRRLQEIDARPIKKVVEAKARKKKRLAKKMDRARKKVESVMDNADMSEREKAKQVKQLYKKAGSDGKKEVKYVVAKKHTSAKRMKRPAGVKGRYKVVDSRMKKDLRAQKAKEKTMGRKKGAGNKAGKRSGKKGGGKQGASNKPPHKGPMKKGKKSK